MSTRAPPRRQKGWRFGAIIRYDWAAVRGFSFLSLLSLTSLGGAWAQARPTAPEALCAARPEYLTCIAATAECVLCHQSVPPPHNPVGPDIAPRRAACGDPGVDPEESFHRWLPAILGMVEELDSDGDGAWNLDELLSGTEPGDRSSFPMPERCGPEVPQEDCRYDAAYAFRRMNLDFCGVQPGYEELQDFVELAPPQQVQRLHEGLDACLDTDFWRGPGGRVWRLGNARVRPSAGEGLVLYDYGLWVYANTDSRDVRDVLIADYIVLPDTIDGVFDYWRLPEGAIGEHQLAPPSRRAGMMTTISFLQDGIMFSALPRTAAAWAYREHLGLDLARLEGLYPVPEEPRDYDRAGVADADCAFCHSTIDPLAYPFSRWQGRTGVPGAYQPDRLDVHFAAEIPGVEAMPEQGFIFGQPVNHLAEWAQVAANSEYFAKKLVQDYWRMIHGRLPDAGDRASFDELWVNLMLTHGYRVESMLHDMVDQDAYGTP
ncbi:MAG: hypothetical protein AAF627_07475 [Myxococcota bacterium]